MVRKRLRRSYPNGKLKDEDLQRTHDMLYKFDLDIPGHCQYDHPIDIEPEILKTDPPVDCSTRKEAESAFHYYNYKKYQLYQSILNGNSFDDISARIVILNDIRWRLVHMSHKIIHLYLNRHQQFQDFAGEIIYQLHHSVDKFNPQFNCAPSTFLYRAIATEAWKCKVGNANNRNLHITNASDLNYNGDIEDDDFYSFYDSRAVDLKCNPVSDEVENQELCEAVNHWLSSFENERDKMVIKMRFLDNLTLRETADKLSLSRERIRQIETSIIRRLRAKADRGQCHFV